MKLKVLLILCILALLSCNNDDDNQTNCTENFVYGLNVSLKDINSNPILSGVEVIASDGDYQETLMTFEGANSFFGAGERPGTYIITVISNSFQTFISDPVNVTNDECHVIPLVLEFELQLN